jgi:uncharacterized protein HemY
LSTPQGTPEEVRVVVASAQLQLKKGDADMAISMLEAIPQLSPSYTQALALKADIYLKNRRDRRLYIQVRRGAD